MVAAVVKHNNNNALLGNVAWWSHSTILVGENCNVVVGVSSPYFRPSYFRPSYFRPSYFWPSCFRPSCFRPSCFRRRASWIWLCVMPFATGMHEDVPALRYEAAHPTTVGVQNQWSNGRSEIVLPSFAISEAKGSADNLGEALGQFCGSGGLSGIW